ncbi:MULTISPECIES: DUF3179 domain-containing (seleno)protein [unclassified Ruegeria]|uniref:DUF3179 domain-containing (seleno)protein n=1 Tax=unclassified Ruegeria TaxID=2625375 RepID=UPI0014889C79|nr:MULTISPECIES: DUF3179 domain-containing (seleno)protein [unclassified Ruegeria]NOD77725.1 DUF3179 domain-containing protein [Ruegeria sp. HKCCD4332]NOD89933.1 DUF3179 domain-containing protein [Ruegeria sp. HKCCD4318]NOE14621.1 DUF3179 domain-containing protein [Ruegeria sp. HKCCD4318-2]NOG11025.1 DUF3179 domain-containing protein [Ruegeria sp. HKCCD4315]
MLANLLFYLGLVVSLSIGFMYFRDLGDISQMVLKVKRNNMIRFIRNENTYIAVGVGGLALMLLGHLMGGGPGWLFFLGAPAVTLLIVFLFVFPWIWVHVGLRNQQDSARYFPISEAKQFINPSASVLVIENNGHARAHSDAQLMRPHLAGNSEGLGGDDIVMTYCAMANLGLAYKPQINGKRLDLEVMAQHGNNLILRDNTTGEPIQQIYGRFDNDPSDQSAMQPWPTFRMSFRGFQKAYPDGEVFLNKPSSNPFLRLFDLFTETVFASGIAKQHQESAPVMDNMSHSDDRLPNKTYVWGVTIADDAVCWTDDFIAEHQGLINANVGGRDVVVAYDPVYESVGVWYNDGGAPITKIDFFGNSNHGKLSRVETLRSGMFWHVWVEFFPTTDINRVGTETLDAVQIQKPPVSEPETEPKQSQ